MDWMQHAYQVNRIWDDMLAASHIQPFDQVRDPVLIALYCGMFAAFFLFGVWVLIWQVWQPLLIPSALLYFTMISLWTAPSLPFDEQRPLRTVAWMYLIGWIATALFLLPEYPIAVFAIWLLASIAPWPALQSVDAGARRTR